MPAAVNAASSIARRVSRSSAVHRVTVAVRERHAFTITARPRHEPVHNPVHACRTQGDRKHGRCDLAKNRDRLRRQLSGLREQTDPLEWKNGSRRRCPLKQCASLHDGTDRNKDFMLLIEDFRLKI
jgi:hypothetical protein